GQWGPSSFPTERKSQNSAARVAYQASLVPVDEKLSPELGHNSRITRNISARWDWLADDAVSCEFVSGRNFWFTSLRRFTEGRIAICVAHYKTRLYTARRFQKT